MDLAIYDYDIVYRPAEKQGNADFCSRFPLKDEVVIDTACDYVKSLNLCDELPLDWSLIAQETKQDAFLQQILLYIKKGWPKRVQRCFKNVYSQNQDLEEVQGCLLVQDRVVVPTSLQNKVLKLLHANHNGIIKMKQLARKRVYWFGINKSIEDFVKGCDTCLKMTNF